MPTGSSLSSQMGNPQIPHSIPQSQPWLMQRILLDTLLGYEVLSYVFISKLSLIVSKMIIFGPCQLISSGPPERVLC